MWGRLGRRIHLTSSHARVAKKTLGWGTTWGTPMGMSRGGLTGSMTTVRGLRVVAMADHLEHGCGGRWQPVPGWATGGRWQKTKGRGTVCGTYRGGGGEIKPTIGELGYVPEMRQRLGLEGDDTSFDLEIDRRVPFDRLRLICGWYLGDNGWADTFKEWCASQGIWMTTDGEAPGILD